MDIDWAGRYMQIVDALVLHSNCVMRNQSKKLDRGGGILLSQHEWQVFSFLVQHEKDDINMGQVSYALAIPKSTLTKISKVLFDHDLIEKYQFVDNKKDIILKPTEKGRELYVNYSWECSQKYFQPLFDGLASLSDEDLAVCVNAINVFSQKMLGDQERKLILRKEDK